MAAKSRFTLMVEAKYPGCLIVRRNGKTHVVVDERHEVGKRNGRPLFARRWSVFQVRLARWTDGTEDVSSSPVAQGLTTRRDAVAAAEADAV